MEYHIPPDKDSSKNINQILQRVRDTLKRLPDTPQLFNEVYFKTKVVDYLLLLHKGGGEYSPYFLIVNQSLKTGAANSYIALFIVDATSQALSFN